MKTSINEARGNINVFFEHSDETEVSPEWHLGERTIQFARIPPDQSLALKQPRRRNLVKVISGFLEQPARRAFCEPRGLQDTSFNGERIVAGAEGAFVTIVTEAEVTPVHDMDELTFGGPLSEALVWKSFDEQFGHVTDAFSGADAYIGPGFHLICNTGEETCFLNIWTAGKGVDLTTHNHGHDPSPLAPAFAETHLVITNGTGSGGMYECAEPGAEKTRYPITAGFEHGPFFDIEKETGQPVVLPNGAVSYPWHGWEAGTDDDPRQSYDLVFAFETLPAMVKIG